MDPDPPQSTHSREPVSPKTIAAEMLTSLILLAGSWGLEWLRSRFEHGVPTLTAASITTSELTIFLYVLRSFVRAIAWAIGEIRDAVSTAGLGNLFGRFHETLKKVFALLREAVPLAKQLQTAWRLLIPILAVGFVVLLGWFVVLSLSEQTVSSLRRPSAETAVTSSKNNDDSATKETSARASSGPEYLDNPTAIPQYEPSPLSSPYLTPQPAERASLSIISGAKDPRMKHANAIPSPTPQLFADSQRIAEMRRLREMELEFARMEREKASTESRSASIPAPAMAPRSPAFAASPARNIGNQSTTGLAISSIYNKFTFVPRVGSLLAGIMLLVFTCARACRAFSLTG